MAPQLMIRCFGGFEVRHGDHVLTGFESQKVRGLLAYLLCHRHRHLSREFLASLFWPEKGEEAARRNLRQAVYNLKRVLPTLDDESADPILADRDRIQIHPKLAIWFDVDEFNAARRRGAAADRIDPHYLAEAAGVYRGEFLQAFSVKDSSEFEHWLTHERERLREQAAVVYKTLVECYMARSEIRLGTRYAHRLAAIDPLSEEAHRYLIQLYGYSGRRSRAVAQYEELRRLLDEELGIEPSEDTQRILADALSESKREDAATNEAEPVGPLLPLVGRRLPYEQLEEQWQRALKGRGPMTLVSGEPGIGKTRLVRSFLDAVSSRSGTTVLKGRCEESIPRPFQPIALVLQNAFSSQTHDADFSLEMVPLGVLQEVSRLLPDLADLLATTPPPISASEDRERLFESIARFLDLFAGQGPNDEGRALILFLDDLHLADKDSCEVLKFLARRRGRQPLWIVATCESTTAESLLADLGETASTNQQRIELERLDELAVEEIAAALVGKHEAATMLPFLDRRGAGLPVAITAWINFLWDEGALKQATGEWRLTRSIDELPSPLDSSIDHLVLQRLKRLPNSTRRLATLASMIGLRFNADLLQRVEEEHLTVIELGLQILLERWLVQRHTLSWATAHGDSREASTAHGTPPRETARDTFEFSHRRIQQAIYRAVSPDRRRFLHQRIAKVMAAEGGAEDRQSEHLAFHLSHAGAWPEAFPHLLTSARKAAAVMAGEVAAFYYERADLAATRAMETSGEGAPMEHWTQVRQELRDERRAFEVKLDHMR